MLVKGWYAAVGDGVLREDPCGWHGWWPDGWVNAHDCFSVRLSVDVRVWGVVGAVVDLV